MDNSNYIAIIDYGMGNISSIKNMLRFLGYNSIFTRDRDAIFESSRLILPGVGNYKKAMENIQSLGLEDIIIKNAKMGKPLLGICLGMQLLLSHSEEGDCDGLDLIHGQVRKFQFANGSYKVPHMGWDYIEPCKADTPLFNGLQECPRYYFVHSYYAQCDNESDVLAKTNYGLYFDSIIQSGSVIGMQFHPEKSHKYGMKILENFLEAKYVS